MSDTGPARISARSFNNHPGMFSGRWLCTGSTLIVSSGLIQPTQRGSSRGSFLKKRTEKQLEAV